MSTPHASYQFLACPDSGMDLLCLHRQDRKRYPFLLESTATQTEQGRFSILFACPGQRIQLNADGTLIGSSAQTFLDALQGEFQQRVSRDAPAQALPFRGGWFVYLSYEMATEVEPGLPPAYPEGPPLAIAVRCPAALIRDHHRQRLYAVAETGAGISPQQLFDDLAACSRTSERDIAVENLQEDPVQPFLEGVERILDYIIEGDIFQVNLSRAWLGRLTQGDATDVYARLRRHNPAPFAGLADFGDFQIISSSPERLVRCRGDRVDTRPIAGTRPRGSQHGEDSALSAELLAHPKEQAEHIMLIDLERNDLGRLCVPGSVEVDELMVLESYATVHHIVSNVSGIMRPEITPAEVIRAVFPGGTITGCPKVRCMEIIHELEQANRGAYTGSFGYVNCDGDMDLNILIRTLVLYNGELSLRAGAGIVADSKPRHELEETRSKAQGMLIALQDAAGND